MALEIMCTERINIKYANMTFQQQNSSLRSLFLSHNSEFSCTNH